MDSRIRLKVSPASRSFRIRATSCTDRGRDARRDLDEDGPDDSAPEIEHQQQALTGDRHQLHALHHQLVQGRRNRDPQLLGQNAEHLGRPADDLLQRVA